MVEKQHIKKLAEEYISDKDIFLVDVRVSTSNRITVLANKMGGITIDECALFSKFLESRLDRETEDFELQVSSPGLDMPFQVREQYDMNIGRRVQVIDSEGKKHTGVLKVVSEQGFEVVPEKKEKGIKNVAVSVSFKFDDIRSVKTVIDFKQ
ncbi:MAG TPA: ribosome assembly cofactor RimP [Bacteroidales bacterium]|nr:ribosome assembly cofactor RimP [Bacteroidales bacterium]